MTASIDGVVTSLNAEEGEETDGTEPLVVVSDLSDTVVTAELTTDEVQLCRAWSDGDNEHVQHDGWFRAAAHRCG